MKSLDEQIEYMRLEVAFNTAILNHRPSWKEEFEMSRAILETLLQLKEKPA